MKAIFTRASVGARVIKCKHFLFQCLRVRLFWNEVEIIYEDKLKLTKHLEIRDFWNR